MKKTLFFLFFLAAISFLACSSDKKERRESAPLASDNISVQPGDSLPQDHLIVDPQPPAPRTAAIDSGSHGSPGAPVEQPVDTLNDYLYKGLMIYRDNVGEFIDCNTQRVYYINDRTNELRGKYYSFELPPNGPLYVEVVGIYVKPDSKAPKRYKRQMNISHLNVMDRTVPYQCGAALTKAKENN